MRVIKATNSIDDIEALKDIAFEWKHTCNGKVFGIDLRPETHFKDLADLIEDKSSELFLLLKKDRIIGYMGVVFFDSPLGNQKICSEHYWYVSGIFDSPLGNQKICSEHYWYVSGKNRGCGTMLLLRAIKNWAKEKGCSHLIMNASCLASNMHDKLCSFYEKIGFRKFETSFIKEI